MSSIQAFSFAEREAPDLKSAFKEDGVVILKNFATRKECDALRERAFALIDAFDTDAHKTVFSTKTQAHAEDDYFLNSGGNISFFLEEEAFDADGKLNRTKRKAINKIGHALHDLDAVFSEFSHSEKMRAAAHSVGFSDPLLLQSMTVMKPPGIGGEVTCHQDSTFLYTEPETCVGFWVAIDEATLENGCMEFIPGAHRGPLRRIFRRKESGVGTEMIELSSDPFPEDCRVAAPAEIGDLVIFSGRAPHMSRANRSLKPRMAYTLHMIERVAHYPPHNWLQRPATMPLKGF